MKFVVHLVIEKWFNQTHTITYFTMIDSVLLHHFTSGAIRHYVLANSLFNFLLHMVIGVSRHTLSKIPQNLFYVCYIIIPVNKVDAIY